MKLIRFRRLDSDRWETASSEQHLYQKLDGEMAEIIMPAKPIWVQLWRKLFPLKGIEMVGEYTELKQ